MKPRVLNIPSSGSVALDLARLKAFEASDEMLHAGLCPNGCGTMAEAGSVAECEACGFEWHRAVLRVGADA